MIGDGPIRPGSLDDAAQRGFRSLLEKTSAHHRDVTHAAAILGAVAELLIEKGLATERQLQALGEAARDGLAGTALGQGMRLAMHDPAASKYAPGESREVDCAARLPLCRAACCHLRPILTREDIEEASARFEFGSPYRVRSHADGRCWHLGPDRQCAIHASRPHACRAYVCADDPRIWTDFEARIPNAAGIEALRRAPVGGVERMDGPLRSVRIGDDPETSDG